MEQNNIEKLEELDVLKLVNENQLRFTIQQLNRKVNQLVDAVNSLVQDQEKQSVNVKEESKETKQTKDANTTKPSRTKKRTTKPESGK